MSAVLIVAGTSVAVKAWWFCVVAAVWVLLYRAAFPAADEPLVDSRTRVLCPGCAELVLTEARVCRFCGYRFAEKLGNP